MIRKYVTKFFEQHIAMIQRDSDGSRNAKMYTDNKVI